MLSLSQHHKSSVPRCFRGSIVLISPQALTKYIIHPDTNGAERTFNLKLLCLESILLFVVIPFTLQAIQQLVTGDLAVILKCVRLTHEVRLDNPMRISLPYAFLNCSIDRTKNVPTSVWATHLRPPNFYYPVPRSLFYPASRNEVTALQLALRCLCLNSTNIVVELRS